MGLTTNNGAKNTGPSYSGVTSLNNSVAGMADDILAVRDNAALRIVLDRFDKNSTPTNFMALLRGVEKAMSSSAFTRFADPDTIANLNGEFTADRAQLGLNGSTTRLGNSVAAKVSYTNQANGWQTSPPPAPTSPSSPPATLSPSMATTFANLKTTPDAIAAVFDQAKQRDAENAAMFPDTAESHKNENAARRVFSQILVGNVFQALIPTAQLPADTTRAFSMDGMTGDKYNSMRASYLALDPTSNSTMSPWLYPSDSGLPINTDMLNSLMKTIDAQTADGTIDAQRGTDLKNILRVASSINGVQPPVSPDKEQWRMRFLQEQQQRQKPSSFVTT